jgi:acyl-CoA synthetase (AMP-forming)/AMP-acid ligase II
MTKPWLKSYDSGMPPNLSYPACSLPYLLHESAKEFPERTAIVFFGHKITYRELTSLVVTTGSHLQMSLNRVNPTVSLETNSPHGPTNLHLLQQAEILFPRNASSFQIAFDD